MLGYMLCGGGGGKGICDPSTLPLPQSMLGTIEGSTETKLITFPQGQLSNANLFTDRLTLFFFHKLKCLT